VEDQFQARQNIYQQLLEFESVGIGLSIVKNIAFKYGWNISVDKSELGGAKFIISF